MATDIIGGLFGVNPQAYQQAQQKNEYLQDYQAAQLDPLQRAELGLRQSGRALGRSVGGLLGMQDPELAKVSQIKQIASNLDLSSPAGLRQLGNAIKDFAPQESMQAIAAADEREKSSLGLQKTRAEISKAELSAANEEKLRAELSAAVNRGAQEPELINIVSKYGSADTILRELSRKQDRADARAAKAAGDVEGVMGRPGPVGKAGAYRDVNGDILGSAEMKIVRQEFEGAQKLLDTLNQVKESDVKDAQSFVDWTTKAESKALASKKTLIAQTKIAASQLMEQINQLPPGSASDADMRASMKSFPGYSDSDALAAWVNETKRKLQFSIDRGQDQFGFKSRVQPTAPLDLNKKKPKAQTNQSDESLIQKYLNPNK